MVIHQLELARKASKDTDDERVVAHLRGRMTLREALGVDEKLIAAYRRQAEALFAAEKWRACADIVEGLVALEGVGLEDVERLVRAYEALGETEKAAATGAVLRTVLEDVEARLGTEVAR